jgi:plasmid stability protein
MASITIRNLDDPIKRGLRLRAAQHGRSMEEEARQILRAALEGAPRDAPDLFAAIRRHIGPLGGVKLAIPRRKALRDPPRFDA